MNPPYFFDPDVLQECAFENLDNPRDNFSFIASVKTDLLWGDLSAVDNPKLSVLIPTFQREQFFAEALDSVLSQYPVDVPWECVVVDNTPLNSQGTTPALEIIRSRGDCRVLYYHNQVNLGSGYNWNRGVELSRGEWIVMLHDDDLLYPHALQSLLAIMDAPPKGKKLGYIHARRDQFTTSDTLPNLKHRDKAHPEVLTRFKSLILGTSGTGMPSCGTAILKKAYKEAGGINNGFGLTADAVLGYQIMKQYRVIVSAPSLGAYRWSDNETLKISSLQKLIYSDYLFAKYRYSQNFFSKLWGYLFWRAEYQENVGYKCKTGNYKQFSLSPQDLSMNIPYRPASAITVFIHKVLRKVFLLFLRMGDFWRY